VWGSVIGTTPVLVNNALWRRTQVQIPSRLHCVWGTETDKVPLSTGLGYVGVQGVARSPGQCGGEACCMWSVPQHHHTLFFRHTIRVGGQQQGSVWSKRQCTSVTHCFPTCVTASCVDDHLLMEVCTITEYSVEITEGDLFYTWWRYR